MNENECLKDWKCATCGHVESWGYGDMVMSGSPVCPLCDEDMKYLG